MEKIYLEKGEILFSEPNKLVCVSGEYDPDELVLVGESDNPLYASDFPLYQYSAEYIKYGFIQKEIL
jgi:hypothetical protein